MQKIQEINTFILPIYIQIFNDPLFLFYIGGFPQVAKLSCRLRIVTARHSTCSPTNSISLPYKNHE